MHALFEDTCADHWHPMTPVTILGQRSPEDKLAIVCFTEHVLCVTFIISKIPARFLDILRNHAFCCGEAFSYGKVDDLVKSFFGATALHTPLKEDFVLLCQLSKSSQIYPRVSTHRRPLTCSFPALPNQPSLMMKQSSLMRASVRVAMRHYRQQ